MHTTDLTTISSKCLRLGWNSNITTFSQDFLGHHDFGNLADMLIFTPDYFNNCCDLCPCSLTSIWTISTKWCSLIALCISHVIAAGFTVRRGPHWGLTIWSSSDRKFTLPSVVVTESSISGRHCGFVLHTQLDTCETASRGTVAV